MYKICPWLHVGNYLDTCNLTLLQKHGIGAMLQLADLVKQPGIVSLYLPVKDGVPLSYDMLNEGIMFIKTHKEQDKRVLVACGAGISRSTTYAIAALKEFEGLDLLDAVCAIKTQNPLAMPHMALWESLCAYYEQDIPFLEMLSRIEPLE